MKNIIIICTIIALVFSTIGCGERMVLQGKKYECYGLMDEGSVRDPRVEYSLIKTNILLSVIFFETIIVPLYIFFFELYEPVGLKK